VTDKPQSYRLPGEVTALAEPENPKERSFPYQKRRERYGSILSRRCPICEGTSRLKNVREDHAIELDCAECKSTWLMKPASTYRRVSPSHAVLGGAIFLSILFHVLFHAL
jgi:hypothetical protein